MDTWFAGELLLRLECENGERFEQADKFKIRFTGAEANAAIAMCSLGAENVHLISAVPNNPIGRSCMGYLRKYGPAMTGVLHTSASGRLGMFYLETGAGDRPSQCVYDRAGSVFATTPAEDYDLDRLFAVPGWLHLSGTLPALSPVTRNLAMTLVEKAKAAGFMVSFDLNYRSALWDAETAGKVFREIASNVDVLISNASVAESFLQTPEKDLCDQYHMTCAALTRRGESGESSFGGTLYRCNGSRVDVPVRPVSVVDRVGGGDAFAGGIIYALQQSAWDDARRIQFAVACGALKHSTRGDFSLSTFAEVENYRNGASRDIKR